jgi:hypothetical protein
MRSGIPVSAVHAAPWRSASCSTHVPIPTMSPVSSASGMNSTGGMSPRVAWSQRTRASNPVVRRSVRRTVGW